METIDYTALPFDEFLDIWRKPLLKLGPERLERESRGGKKRRREAAALMRQDPKWVDEQARIAKMTNWQRTQWARATDPKGNSYKPELINKCLKMEKP